MLYIQPLTAEEISELEKLTRQAVGRIAERAWYLILSNQGKSIPEICEIFGRHPTCVRDWIKRYQLEGISGLQDKAPKGRPKKVNQEMKEKIDAQMHKSPAEMGFLAGFWTIPLLLIHIIGKFSLNLSPTTLRNILYELGYRCRRPRLAASKFDELAAEKMAAIAEVFRNNRDDCVILYEDETTFRLLPLIRKMWMKLHEQIRIITPNNWNRRFSVFGALNVKTAQFSHAIHEKANSESFIEFLEQLLKEYPHKTIFLILDNASYHKSHMVQDWLKVHPKIQFLWLPKNNPQLNPVEKIWWYMKDKVAVNRSYKGLKNLKQGCIEFFKNFTPEDAIRLTQVAV